MTRADLSLDTVIKAHVLRVFELEGRNKTRAARALGIDRRTLYRYLIRSEAFATSSAFAFQSGSSARR